MNLSVSGFIVISPLPRTGSLTNASKMMLWLGFTDDLFFHIIQNGFYRVVHLSALDNFDSDAHFNVYMLK